MSQVMQRNDNRMWQLQSWKIEQIFKIQKLVWYDSELCCDENDWDAGYGSKEMIKNIKW